MTAKEASCFLYNFPGLTEAAGNKREDILSQGRQEVFAGGFRGGQVSDPTAKRGILLADGRELEDILSSVKNGLTLNCHLMTGPSSWQYGDPVNADGSMLAGKLNRRCGDVKRDGTR